MDDVVLFKKTKMTTKTNILKNAAQWMIIVLCSILVFASCRNASPKAPASNNAPNIHVTEPSLSESRSFFNPNISMTVPTSMAGSFTIAGTGTVVIDWGDGTVEKETLKAHYDNYVKYGNSQKFSHSYSESSDHTVKIIGNNIMLLTIAALTMMSNGQMTNNLTSLDVSSNIELIELNCHDNQLTKLDLYNNTKLRLLGCTDNQLTELDLRANTAIKYLWCSGNQLTELDLSANILLISLGCSNNQLTKLDLRNNTAIILILCSNNQLTELDIKANTALTDLWCENNLLMGLDLKENKMITVLGCSNNQLTKLDLSANKALRLLDYRSNNLSTDALNALFETLHNNTFEYEKTVYIANNPGTEDCNKSIAEEKGWTVNIDVDIDVDIDIEY